jgi:hypothetical protein
MAKMFHSLLFFFSGEFRVHPSLATDPDQMVQSARWLRITDAQIGRRTYLGLADWILIRFSSGDPGLT